MCKYKMSVSNERNKQLISVHIVTAKRTMCVIVEGAGVSASALPLMDFAQQKQKLCMPLYIFSILYIS